MGPDHPQIEMYEYSKHGVRFATFGDTKTTPVCVDCHMANNSQMLGKKTAEDGTKYTDHNLALGMAYGPIGGGTTRKGFVLEDSGRVKFAARDGDALYENVWLERSDGKIYDQAEGGSIVFDDIYQLSIADESGNLKQDYAVMQPADSAETLLENREFMRDKVCAKCHTKNFSDEHLLIADLVHENAKTIMGEAFDVVKAMAMLGYQSIPTDDKTENPETGTSGTYGANMKVRNLTKLEKVYFEAMKFDSVMAWKGAYHFNPDYAHWYGYNALVMKLGVLGDVATDAVLQFIWINGDDYPGDTGNIFSDGLYQGVVYETGSLENAYDKFPGPNDPGADEPIDVNMDGEADFVPVDGNPGTFTIDGKEITFH
jgi:mono/diheme cytochrome c family protein